mgnify:CR=1 FL=1
MEDVISFTPAQIIAFVLALCGAIVSISAALGVITKAIEKARAEELLLSPNGLVTLDDSQSM